MSRGFIRGWGRRRFFAAAGQVAGLGVAGALAGCQQGQQSIVVTPAAQAGGQGGVTPTAAPVSSPVACHFELGFAQMRTMVGPSTVGDCVENERQIPGNGNAEQRTTNGLLVFRAIDQRILFIGANQTWINRDGAIVTRPNNQRFEWEGDRQMVEALRRGGQIVYFRHGPTDPAQRDSDPTNLANCETQRNLTDAGRAQARAIGEAFRTLNIPVGQVLSSEYCRALEYARLAFNRAEVTPSLVLPDPLTEQERAQNTEALKGLLGTPPQPGMNTIMVSHSPNIRLAAGVDLPAEGGAAVFRVEGQGLPPLLARVLPDEWTTFARALPAR